MPTLLRTYASYPDGAVAAHTHFGFGASSIASGKLVTTGLASNQIGGATLDGTESAGFKRVRARLNILDLDGSRAGGVVLNFTYAPFAGFRVKAVYQNAAIPANASIGIDVIGSRVGDTLLASQGFLTGGYIALADVIIVEAQYTPGVGAADGLLEYRGWVEGRAVPLYKNVAVHSSYAAIVGPGGALDNGITFAGGSNTKFLSVEVQGIWYTEIATNLAFSPGLDADLSASFDLAAVIAPQVDIEAELYGWFSFARPSEDWEEEEAPSTGWVENGD